MKIFRDLPEALKKLQVMLRNYKLLLYVLLAGVVMVLFSYSTPPMVKHELVIRLPLLRDLPGDLPIYALRFALSLILLGLLPLALALILGERLKSIGLCSFKPPFSRFIFSLILALSFLLGAAGAYYPEFFSYYPFSNTLLELIVRRGFSLFFIHTLLYLVFYYIPWELFFRGILIFPFIRFFTSWQKGKDKQQNRAALIIIASLQAIPSSLLHFGHPFTETLGAIPFGLFAGYLALKTGSILPGLMIHSLVGITLDLFITLRYMGILPL